MQHAARGTGIEEKVITISLRDAARAASMNVETCDERGVKRESCEQRGE